MTNFERFLDPLVRSPPIRTNDAFVSNRSLNFSTKNYQNTSKIYILEIFLRSGKSFLIDNRNRSSLDPLTIGQKKKKNYRLMATRFLANFLSDVIDVSRAIKEGIEDEDYLISMLG